VNNQKAVSFKDNPDAADIQDTNYYSQSSTHVNVGYGSGR